LPETYTTKTNKEIHDALVKYKVPVVRMGDIAHIRSFRAVPKGNIVDKPQGSIKNGIPYLKIKAIKYGLIDTNSTDQIVENDATTHYLEDQILSKAKGTNPGILIALHGKDIQTAEYDPLDCTAFIPHHNILYITPKDQKIYSVRFLLSFLNSELGKNQILVNLPVSYLPKLTKKQLIELKVPALSIEEQRDFIKEQEIIWKEKAVSNDIIISLLSSLNLTSEQSLKEKIEEILLRYTSADSIFYYDWKKFFPEGNGSIWYRKDQDIYLLISDNERKYGVVQLKDIGLGFNFSMIQEISMVLAIVINNYKTMMESSHEISMHMIAHNMKNKLSTVKTLLDDVQDGLIRNNVSISTMNTQSDDQLADFSEIFEEPQKSLTILETIVKIYDQLRDISTSLYYTDPPALYNLANELTELIEKSYKDKGVKIAIVSPESPKYDLEFSKMALVEPLKVFIDNALEHSGECQIEVVPGGMAISNDLKSELSEEQKDILLNFKQTVSVKTNSWGIGRKKAKELIEEKIGTVECHFMHNSVVHEIQFNKIGRSYEN
jgi:hypothetical protein